MLVLAIDSSGLTASAALVTEEKTVAEYTVNHRKTHSRTLLPMIDEMMKMTGIDLSSIDAIAVSGGPGSFTGLRIGSATAKGLGLALDCPIISVPTLDALAYGVYGWGHIICPIMDARRNQVYTGIYTFSRRSGEKEGPKLTKPTFMVIRMQMAARIEELIRRINIYNRPTVFLGDAVPVYKETLQKGLKVPFSFAPSYMNRQRAALIGALGICRFKAGKFESAMDHKPEYLRPSQAEREVKEQKKNPEVKVRLIRPKDVPAVAELEKRIFSEPWSEKGVQETMAQPSFIGLAAETSGRVCGYLLAYDTAGEAEIARIAVEEDLRRHGVGTRLMQGFLKLCSERGVKRVFLEAREGNLSARKFYKMAGFSELKKRLDFYQNPRENAILMTLTLQAK